MTTASFFSLILPLFLAFLMFGIGLTLTINNFKNILIYPRAILLGSIGQLLLLPASAFLLCYAFDMAPAMAVGIILVSACPGGPVSNLFSYLAGGDAALSVTLTALSTAVTILTIPVYTNWALQVFMPETAGISMPLAATAIKIFVTVGMPVLLGMIVRHLWPVFSCRVEMHLNKASTWLVAILIAYVLYKERHHLLTTLSGDGLIIVFLLVCAMFIGYLMSRVFNLSAAHTKTVIIEIGFQNAVLAFTLAISLLNSTEIALPTALYTTISTPVLGVLVLIFRCWKAGVVAGPVSRRLFTE